MTTVHRRRLRAQLLSGSDAKTPEAVVRRLLAVQGQDPRGARLAIRTRSRGLRGADVDVALTERRSLVITWLNRGTLHLVTSEDYWWLHPLTTPQLVTGNTRRLQQEGVTPAQTETGIEVVGQAVADGPRSRLELRTRLEEAGVPTRGAALVHVLMAASIRGLMVRGPMNGSEHAFVSVPDWLGTPPPALPREEALARLARRYLAGHGPAGPRDLARWAGVTLGAARAALAAIADETLPVTDPTTPPDADLVDLADRGEPADLPPPRLLGAFDPLLLGWVSREPVVGRHLLLVTDNGLFRPFALVRGRAVATWGLAQGVMTVRQLEELSAAVRADLAEDAADVLRYLGLPVREPEFTGPG